MDFFAFASTGTLQAVGIITFLLLLTGRVVTLRELMAMKADRDALKSANDVLLSQNKLLAEAISKTVNEANASLTKFITDITAARNQSSNSQPQQNNQNQIGNQAS